MRVSWNSEHFSSEPNLLHLHHQVQRYGIFHLNWMNGKPYTTKLQDNVLSSYYCFHHYLDLSLRMDDHCAVIRNHL